MTFFMREEDMVEMKLVTSAEMMGQQHAGGISAERTIASKLIIQF